MLIQFARNYQILGDTGKQFERASEAYDLLAGLAAEKPGDKIYHRDLSVAYAEVGDVLVSQGKLSEALRVYRESLAIIERLAKTRSVRGCLPQSLRDRTRKARDGLVGFLRDTAKASFRMRVLVLGITVLATQDTPATLAAKAVTTTIPIVFYTAADPVEVGFVANLARPGPEYRYSVFTRSAQSRSLPGFGAGPDQLDDFVDALCHDDLQLCLMASSRCMPTPCDPAQGCC